MFSNWTSFPFNLMLVVLLTCQTSGIRCVAVADRPNPVFNVVTPLKFKWFVLVTNRRRCLWRFAYKQKHKPNPQITPWVECACTMIWCQWWLGVCVGGYAWWDWMLTETLSAHLSLKIKDEGVWKETQRTAHNIKWTTDTMCYLLTDQGCQICVPVTCPDMYHDDWNSETLHPGCWVHQDSFCDCCARCMALEYGISYFDICSLFCLSYNTMNCMTPRYLNTPKSMDKVHGSPCHGKLRKIYFDI